MTEPTVRLRNIQALRGLAALLVVFSHLYRIEAKYAGDPLLPDFLLSGISGVDLFFAISGFIMVVTTRGVPRGMETAGRFLLRRAQRIYPLYWFYTALVLAVVAWQPGWVNQGRPFDLLSSLLLWPHALGPLLQVGWTLEHEVYFYLVFGAALCVVPERRLGWMLFVWAAVILAGAMQFRGGSPVAHLALHAYTLEFIGGSVVGLTLRAVPQTVRPGFWFGLCGASVIALMACGWLNEPTAGLDERAIRHMWRVILVGLPAMALVFGASMLDQQGWHFPRWLATLGDASYSMYLSHVLVLSAIGRLWQRLAQDGPLDNVGMWLLSLIGVVAVSLASFRWIESPLLRRRRHERRGPADVALAAQQPGP